MKIDHRLHFRKTLARPTIAELRRYGQQIVFCATLQHLWERDVRKASLSKNDEEDE
jgi:hypothetical protein